MLELLQWPTLSNITFPKTIRDWNNLPHDLIESDNFHYLNLSCKQSFDSELILIAYIILQSLIVIVMYSFGLVPWTHQTLFACPILTKKKKKQDKRMWAGR